MSIEPLFKKFNIKFDKHENVVISKTKLIAMLSNYNMEKSIIIKNIPDKFHILIDRNQSDLYIIQADELPEWYKDGSFEVGDKLYFTEFLEKF